MIIFWRSPGPQTGESASRQPGARVRNQKKTESETGASKTSRKPAGGESETREARVGNQPGNRGGGGFPYFLSGCPGFLHGFRCFVHGFPCRFRHLGKSRLTFGSGFRIKRVLVFRVLANSGLKFGSGFRISKTRASL